MTAETSRPGAFARFLADGEWLYLLLILPLVLFPTPARALVLLGIPLFWLARRVGYGRFFVPTPVDWPLAGLALMGLVSLYATPDLLFSLPKVVGLAYGLAVFAAVVFTVQTRPGRLWPAAALLLLSGLVVVGLGSVGVRWTNKFDQLDALLARLPPRLLALPGAEAGVSPNEVAGVLLWVLPVGVALSVALLGHGRALWRQRGGATAVLVVLFVWGATAAMGLMMLLTQSRAGLLGLLAGLGLLLLLALGRVRWWLAAGLLLALLLAGTAVWQTGSEALVASFTAQAGERSLETMAGRVEIWERAVYGLQDFALTGMGMNMFRVHVFTYYPTFFLNRDSDFAHAHNHFLQAGLDLGLPGLVAYAALWLGMAALVWQAWRRAESLWRRALAGGGAAALAAYFVYGLVDAVALGARPGFIFWLLLGLLAAAATDSGNGS